MGMLADSEAGPARCLPGTRRGVSMALAPSGLLLFQAIARAIFEASCFLVPKKWDFNSAARPLAMATHIQGKLLHSADMLAVPRMDYLVLLRHILVRIKPQVPAEGTLDNMPYWVSHSILRVLAFVEVWA